MFSIIKVSPQCPIFISIGILGGIKRVRSRVGIDLANMIYSFLTTTPDTSATELKRHYPPSRQTQTTRLPTTPIICPDQFTPDIPPDHGYHATTTQIWLFTLQF